MKDQKAIKIRICGKGGQGIVLLGNILGLAGVLQGKFVSALPSIGPEPRGGISSSDVIMSNEPIDFPKIDRADMLIAFSSSSYERHAPILTDDGLVFYDTLFLRPAHRPEGRGLASNGQSHSQSHRPRYYGIPAALSIQKETKGLMGSNIALLAFAVRLARIVSLDVLTKAVRALSPADALTANLKAIEVGIRLSRKVKYP